MPKYNNHVQQGASEASPPACIKYKKILFKSGAGTTIPHFSDLIPPIGALWYVSSLTIFMSDKLQWLRVWSNSNSVGSYPDSVDVVRVKEVEQVGCCYSDQAPLSPSGDLSQCDTVLPDVSIPPFLNGRLPWNVHHTRRSHIRSQPLRSTRRSWEKQSELTTITTNSGNLWRPLPTIRA